MTRLGATLGLVAVLAAAGCGSDGSAAGDDGSTTTATAVVEDLVMEASDFVNINDMTPVRGYFIDNRLGDLDEALAVAEDPEGGTYPVGTIIQLVPSEAMVKRAPGFSPATNDWEFFSLAVSPEGTEILQRGGPDVVNQFGGSCADCHLQADPQFDLVCEDTHGCAPLPIGDDVIQ
ncbi:MAG TPA: hypothetical protein VFK43_21545, partial [Acidimicrobiales bacterium]|nr:hypothetical protein [Acidimicrobiales bacterium]